MLDTQWHPWGLLPWVLDKISISRWHLLGSFSTEERCHAVLKTLQSRNQLEYATLMWVKDPPSRFADLAKARLKARLREIDHLNISQSILKIEEHQLFERTDSTVKSVKNIINDSCNNIIIDITTFPKRLFFPIIRLILETESIINLLVTYTRAENYTSTLAENPQTWNHIPLFGPTSYPEAPPQVVIVGIGFMPLGLPDLFEQGYDNVAIKLLLPFPPGPPHFQRNWEFIRVLEKNLSRHNLPETIRVNPWDLSECFNFLCSATDGGKLSSILAPYGPKTLSLAMCLFAWLTSVPVYYTQPKAYHPDYSIGIATENDVPQVFAYCLRLNGKNLYRLP